LGVIVVVVCPLITLSVNFIVVYRERYKFVATAYRQVEVDFATGVGVYVFDAVDAGFSVGGCGAGYTVDASCRDEFVVVSGACCEGVEVNILAIAVGGLDIDFTGGNAAAADSDGAAGTLVADADGDGTCGTGEAAADARAVGATDCR
jgi:hypothetical protein